jgi:hypothetical protein
MKKFQKAATDGCGYRHDLPKLAVSRLKLQIKCTFWTKLTQHGWGGNHEVLILATVEDDIIPP